MRLLKEHKPIRVFIEDSDFGIYYYDPVKRIYQGVIGYMPIEAVYKCVKGCQELDHIRIEEV